MAVVGRGPGHDPGRRHVVLDGAAFVVKPLLAAMSYR